ncbi:hypothetical protein [Mesoflavibacter sp. CH_XMU1404-2]|uniref:hypothetical protein n=1 Tax=Mesoflavibacter sp. CH_XMU1404-2 TaxID=3107766 RepID=UPI00300AD3F4
MNTLQNKNSNQSNKHQIKNGGYTVLQNVKKGMSDAGRQIVTFDFDSTLSHKIVQDFAKSLILKGFEVWVLTSRYDEIHKHKYRHNPTNEDLYKVTDKIGIDRTRIRFQCMRPKAEYLFGTNVIWHLDDDYVEVNEINSQTDTKGIDVTQKGWKKKCKSILGIE